MSDLPPGIVICPLCGDPERELDIVGGVCLACADGIAFAQNNRRGSVVIYDDIFRQLGSTDIVGQDELPRSDRLHDTDTGANGASPGRDDADVPGDRERRGNDDPADAGSARHRGLDRDAFADEGLTFLLESEYQPGDMAHPLPPPLTDWLYDQLTDPDNWVKGFMLVVCFWVAFVVIVTPR